MKQIDKVRSDWTRYTGQQSDADSGLLYLRARYYEANTGRFITQDPKKGDLKDPASFNLYIYCKNNPIRYIDPSGLDRIDFYLFDKARQYNQSDIKKDLKGNDVNFYFFKDRAGLMESLYESFQKADYVVIRGHSGPEGFGIPRPSFCVWERAKMLLNTNDIMELLLGMTADGVPVTTKRIIGQGCNSMLQSELNLSNACEMIDITYIGTNKLIIFRDSILVKFILADIKADKPWGSSLDLIINKNLGKGYQRLK